MAREMKDSGVQWLGCIPDDWGVEQAGQALYQVKNKNTGMAETNLLSLSYGRVKRRDIDARGGLLPESFEGYNIVEADDIVLRFTDLQNDQRSLRTGRVTERGIITSAYTTVRPVNPAASRFLHYALHAYDLRKGFYGMGSGVRQGLKWQEAKYILIPKPSDDEQRRIADYLDDRCAEVDRAIEAAERSIEEYKLLRQSTISHSVIQGITECDTRNSGLVFAPYIPASWSVVPAYVIFREQNISAMKGDIQLSLSQTDGLVPSDSTIVQGRRPGAFGDWLHVMPGNLVMNRFKAPLGVFFMSEYEGMMSGNYRVFSAKLDVNMKYYEYLFHSSSYRDEFGIESNGVTDGLHILTNTKFLMTKCLLPTRSVQDEIVRYLDSITEATQELTLRKRAMIDELVSYKQSLVYEVVTGKREV